MTHYFKPIAGGCLALQLLSCNRAEGGARVEPERESITASAQQVQAPEPPSQGKGSATRCIVPLAEPPPQPATPAKHCPQPDDISVPLIHGKVTFIEAPNAPAVDVELAESTEDQQRGLMYRTTLGEDAGMLFSWSGERVRTFWMHNTCVPLDMLFIAKDGTISGILEQVPVLNDAPRSINCPVSYVLEVNAGYIRKHNIAPGQRVKIENR